MVEGSIDAQEKFDLAPRIGQWEMDVLDSYSKYNVGNPVVAVQRIVRHVAAAHKRLLEVREYVMRLQEWAKEVQRTLGLLAVPYPGTATLLKQLEEIDLEAYR